MKILLRHNGNNDNGIRYHRQTSPHNKLVDDYPCDVSACKSLGNLKKDYLDKFDIVQISRIISDNFQTEKLIEKLHNSKIKVVFDIDDYWELPDYHVMNTHHYKKTIRKNIEDAIRCSDHITTSTEYLADKIRPINSNVTVIPNAIDDNHDQWRVHDNQRPRFAFGWIGGVHHIKDIRLLRHYIRHLWGKAQFCLGGYTPNFFYKDYEFVFSNNHSLPKEYRKILSLQSRVMDHYSMDKDYRRLWGTVSPSQYGYQYEDIDCSLAPLFDDFFTRGKSQLKIIESGFKKKPIICSDVGAYAVEADKGCPADFVSGDSWVEVMEEYIADPCLAKKKGDQLYDYVKENYDIKKVNEIRWNLYQSLV